MIILTVWCVTILVIVWLWSGGDNICTCTCNSNHVTWDDFIDFEEDLALLDNEMHEFDLKLSELQEAVSLLQNKDAM